MPPSTSPPANRADRRCVPLDQRLAVSVSETAQALGICRDSVYSLLHSGALRSVRVGARQLIPVSELRRLVGDDPEPPR